MFLHVTCVFLDATHMFLRAAMSFAYSSLFSLNGPSGTVWWQRNSAMAPSVSWVHAQWGRPSTSFLWPPACRSGSPSGRFRDSPETVVCNQDPELELPEPPGCDLGWERGPRPPIGLRGSADDKGQEPKTPKENTSTCCHSLGADRLARIGRAR